MFTDVWIPPVPHDAGVSLGAALMANRRPARLPHAFWGPEPGPVAPALRRAGLPDDPLPEHEVVSRVADHLAAGRLVGWWQGRSEIGQRALGARSILCDPRRRDQLVRLNTLKGREVWRPLAPSVLADSVPALFGMRLPAPAEFMLCAWPVLAEAKPLIPAAVHVDGTARPQVVHEAVNPRYWAVIDAFRRRTGVPAVVNTSFNLAGEPNVLTIDDAVSTFLRGRLDVLAAGDFVVKHPRPGHTAGPNITTRAGTDLHALDRVTPATRRAAAGPPTSGRGARYGWPWPRPPRPA